MFAVEKAFNTNAVTLYYQFCPMANDGQGAYWVSEREKISNPYMGTPNTKTHTQAIKMINPENAGMTCSGANLVQGNEARKQYLIAIKEADNGNLELLLKFARS